MKPVILCAHDLTDSSDPALRVALDFRRRLGAELTVLFVAVPPYPAPPGLWFAVEEANYAGLAERITAAGRIELQKRLLALARPEDGDVHLLVEEGEPGKTILEVASRLQATLLVLGTHARKGWQHLMLGSVAERVVRTASLPVLTVGPGVAVAEAPRSQGSERVGA